MITEGARVTRKIRADWNDSTVYIVGRIWTPSGLYNPVCWITPESWGSTQWEFIANLVLVEV